MRRGFALLPQKRSGASQTTSRMQLAPFSCVRMRLITAPSLPMTTVWRYASSGLHDATSLLTFGGGCVAEVDVKVIAPARAITVFSLARTGTLEVFAASEGTPSAAIHASVPYFTHSSYGSTPKPQLPQTRPQEFWTTKPTWLNPTSANAWPPSESALRIGLTAGSDACPVMDFLRASMPQPSCTSHET